MQRRRPRTSLPLHLRLLLPLPLAQCPRSLLRSFSCFKCRLVVWDATAAQGEEDGGQENNENSNSHNEGLSSCVELRRADSALLARLF